MSNYPTLKNPPIVEAILDVQVIFPQGVELSALASLHENFQSDYPQKNEERIVQFGLEHQAGEPPKALAQDQGVRGYRFISKDGKQIVQCRKDGFTFNRLSPYASGMMSSSSPSPPGDPHPIKPALDSLHILF